MASQLDFPSSKSGLWHSAPGMESEPLVLQMTVRTFLRWYKTKSPAVADNSPRSNKRETKSREKEWERDNTLESYFHIVRISAEDHRYWDQWKHTVWTMDDIADILQVIRIHELQSLSLQGKGLWLLHKVLLHSEEHTISFRDKPKLTNDLLEVLFEVSITQPAYNSSLSTLQLVVKKFGLLPVHVFTVGKFMLIVELAVWLIWGLISVISLSLSSLAQVKVSSRVFQNKLMI
jgi:hypothetical protein